MPVQSQEESQGYPDPKKVWERIKLVLEAENAPEIARKLNLAKQSVYEWQKKLPGLDSLISISKSGNASLHWLLTGEGSRWIQADEGIGGSSKVNFPPHIWRALEQAAEENQNTLDEELNQIVFAQLAMRGLVSYKIVPQDDMDEVAKPLLDSVEGDVEIMGRPHRSKLALPLEEETETPRRKKAQ